MPGDGSDPLSIRRRFAARLRGHGVEIGPGHAPFPLPSELVVRYVDRWEPDENSALFPELERPLRTLEHLADEFDLDVREVAHDHVVEAIVAQVRFNGDHRDPRVLAAERTDSEIALHRRRSIHAHVWDMEKFSEVLSYAGCRSGIR